VTENKTDSTPHEGPRAVPGLPDYWQQFGICVLFHFLVPLLPLFGLWFMGQHITEHEFLLTAAIYVLAIGTSSKSKLIHALSYVFALLFTIACGRPADPQGRIPGSEKWLAVVAFLAVIVPHLIERYNRHVVLRAPFMES
jgi:hypothetical protein